MSPLTLIPGKLAITLFFVYLLPQLWQPSAPLKVQVKLYVEALCIDSKRFFITQLMPTYSLLGSDVIDLQVVSFGNAKIVVTAARHVECQHGVAECDANVYELCAAAIYREATRYLPFLDCLFNVLPMGHRDSPFETKLFLDCARQSALDFDLIQACHNNPDKAWELQVEASKETPSDHTFVPWVLINGEHSMDEERDSFLDKVCQAYMAAGGLHSACM